MWFALWFVLTVALTLATVFALRYWEKATGHTPLLQRERELQKRVTELEREIVQLQTSYESRIKQLEDRIEFLLEELETRKRTIIDMAGAAQPAYVTVVVGSDPALDVDLAAFRKVQSKTKMRFTRLSNATTVKFERYLERQRAQGTPARRIHLALHAGPTGVEFVDKTVNGLWLSERLKDCEILLIDGCSADFVGDYIGVVPFVITLMEEIEHHHAMLLAELFWTEIGRNAQPELAYYSALDRCPPGVAEFAQLHM